MFRFLALLLLSVKVIDQTDAVHRSLENGLCEDVDVIEHTRDLVHLCKLVHVGCNLPYADLGVSVIRVRDILPNQHLVDLVPRDLVQTLFAFVLG